MVVPCVLQRVRPITPQSTTLGAALLALSGPNLQSRLESSQAGNGPSGACARFLEDGPDHTCSFSSGKHRVYRHWSPHLHTKSVEKGLFSLQELPSPPRSHRTCRPQASSAVDRAALARILVMPRGVCVDRASGIPIVSTRPEMGSNRSSLRLVMGMQSEPPLTPHLTELSSIYVGLYHSVQSCQATLNSAIPVPCMLGCIGIPCFLRPHSFDGLRGHPVKLGNNHPVFLDPSLRIHRGGWVHPNETI